MVRFPHALRKQRVIAIALNNGLGRHRSRCDWRFNLEAAQDWQGSQIAQPALNELVVALNPTGRGRYDESTTEYVDWFVRFGTNEALFAVIAKPSLKIARARTDDDRCLAMPVKGFGQHSFVAVNVEDCQSA